MKIREALADTLLQPFQEQLIAPSENEQGTFLIRAQVGKAFDQTWKDLLICEQTLKSENTYLEKAGFQTTTEITGQFDLGLCILTKHKKEDYGNLARAFWHLNENGTLLCVGHNSTGPKSIEKALSQKIPIAGKISKNHCRAFWCQKPDDLVVEEWEDWEKFSKVAANIEDRPYLTQPGMFSWDKIDRGSQFLTEHFPQLIRGKVADFGSGWGYLSDQLLQRCPAIKSLDLFENEKLALDVSRRNIANEERLTNFHWFDLIEGTLPTRNYDWVVMNPPFHTASQTDIHLGCHFIEAAAQALHSKGSLLMVANRHLPYENELKPRFKSFEIVAESPAFKILLATEPLRK